VAKGLKPIQTPWGAGGQWATSGTGALPQGQGCLTYFSAWETSGSNPAVVQLYDGDGNNGRLMLQYNLAASQSTSEMWGLHWKHFTSGLYVLTVSGAAAGTGDAWVDHSCVDYNISLYHLARYAQLELEMRFAEITGTLPPPPP
jgi:hypothetical protein